jgi:hypothetical protein
MGHDTLARLAIWSGFVGRYVQQVQREAHTHERALEGEVGHSSVIATYVQTLTSAKEGGKKLREEEEREKI